MKIDQFEDKNLSHYSYSIISDGKMALIDPQRNPQPYYDLATESGAEIIAVIETHPHADFVSSHLEIHQTTGATIYVSKLLGAEYEHVGFDDGDEIKIGNISLRSINTPGHSPDSISIVAVDENGKQKAVFTGDTLFIGDCGRPDLREKAGSLTASRKDLARQMYYSLREKLYHLPDDVLVYPSHGAGSLCGKGLSENNSSTIGIEKASNWCFQKATEEEFVHQLLIDQPFVPKYFSYEVQLNKKGAPGFLESIAKVNISEAIPESFNDLVIIDTRPGDLFQKGSLKNSINLMDDIKFETWLGSIVSPGEKFYLLAENKNELNGLIERIARIGYESQIETAFVAKNIQGRQMESLDVNDFRKSPENYAIVDVRNPSEVRENKNFKSSINIPVYELRERVHEIPLDKPIVVHCAAGYRSAAAASILKNSFPENKIFNLGEAITTF